MANHRVYYAIVKAVKNNGLEEPFKAGDLRNLFKKKFADSTYSTFLPKHRKRNPGKNSELFERSKNTASYSLIEPYKYKIDC